mgnify:CR=1 FL=1|tara:strand:- start:129 stop:566 length:438 start_codon:yes stop_codon:yes gene_type:complete
MPVKTFRGLIASGDTDTITLHTNNGAIGYRIVKFRMMTVLPGTTDYEHIMKIWKVPGEAADEEIDFSNQRLLSAGFSEGAAATNFQGNEESVIFDNEIFNQDIYITQFDSKSGLPCNYYLELEQIKLDLTQNTVATLKDIRNTQA